MTENTGSSFRNEFNGVVSGQSVQANIITGGVHFYQSDTSLTQEFDTALSDLGSDIKLTRLAAVQRFGAIERKMPQLRQSIVDILCDYLQVSDVKRVKDWSPSTGGLASALQKIIAEDLPVRIAVQDLLRQLLHEPNSSCGTDEYIQRNSRTPVDLDLSGATLVDFDLSSRAVSRAMFQESRFVGHIADFRNTHFEDRATFDNAVFECPAIFKDAYFTGGASYVSARFDTEASFVDSTSDAWMVFGRASFFTPPDLENAKFFDCFFDCIPVSDAHGITFLR